MGYRGDDRQYARLREYALQHGGCFTRGAAYEQGVSKHAFDVSVDKEHFVSYRGVYALAGTDDTIRARTWAALFRAGPGALVTGPSALAAYRFDGLIHCLPSLVYLPVFISVPTNRHLRIDDVVTLREVKPCSLAHYRNGLPLVDNRRAAIDALRLLGFRDARQLLYRALQLDWVTAEYLERMCEVLIGTKGNRQLRKLAADAMSGSHAESESVLHRLLSKERISGWKANLAVYDADGLIGYIDVAIVQGDVWLAIEVDGRAWHTDHARFEGDRNKTNRVMSIGWRFRRFTWEDLTQHPARTVAFIHDSLVP